MTVEFAAIENGTLVKPKHSGFPDEGTKDGHEQGWPEALALLDQRMS